MQKKPMAWNKSQLNWESDLVLSGIEILIHDTYLGTVTIASVLRSR